MLHRRIARARVPERAVALRAREKGVQFAVEAEGRGRHPCSIAPRPAGGRRCRRPASVFNSRLHGAKERAMDLGFIGLGEMGQAIATNLLKAGHTVRVWNRSRERAEPLAAFGAQIVDTPADAFRGDAVFSMLGDDAAARAVFDDALLAQAPRGLIHVNMATVSVALAESLAHAHASRGIDYVAAPVMGRPDVAAAARLTIMAGGPAEAIDRVQPLFDAIGQKTWRFGSLPQHANVAKIAANFTLASAIETLGEASALLGAHGVAMRDFLDVITSSVFPGPVYEGYGSMIAERRYEPARFKARLGLKDVRLALEAGDATSVPLPVASVVRDSLLDALAHGGGEQDFAVLGEVALRRAGR
ncbi:MULTISPECIES: NAD(P)-dependent oxidoreductase [Burkholderia cepacia complex]|uniref:NAD(P)-dependent oxidoreductase n=1 Tax=Burkholderia cepacia complex TaxID=87882 RepID=UPI002157ADE8|nr:MULTISPECIES: NAD(P)-dependent oxidoreductase [Burkholderia cepacia complex]